MKATAHAFTPGQKGLAAVVYAIAGAYVTGRWEVVTAKGPFATVSAPALRRGDVAATTVLEDGTSMEIILRPVHQQLPRLPDVEILKAYERGGGNAALAARQLGISVRMMFYRLRDLGVSGGRQGRRASLVARQPDQEEARRKWLSEHPRSD